MNNSQQALSVSSLKLLTSQYGVAIINLIFMMILLRLMTKTEFAVIAVMEIFTSILAFTDLGLNSVYLQRSTAKINQKDTKAIGFVKLCFLVKSFNLLIIGSILIFCSDTFAEYILQDKSYSFAIKILVFGAIAASCFDSLKLLAQSLQDFSKIAKWIFWSGAFRQCTGLLLYLFFGFIAYITGIVTVIIISSALMAWSMREYLFNKIPMASFIATVSYGFPFYLKNFFRYGFMQFDQLLVGLMLSPELLATYSVAKKFSSYINLATGAFINPLGMRAAALRDESILDHEKLFHRSSYYIILTMFPLCLIVALSSPFLMWLQGGDKYIAGWPILTILCFSQMIYVIYSFYSLFIFALALPKYSLLNDFSAGFTNALISPFFLYYFSETGIAVGLVISFVVGTIVAKNILNKYGNFTFNFQSFVIQLIPLLLMTTIVLSGYLVNFSILLSPVYLIVGLLCYIIITCRFFRHEDWQISKSIYYSILSK